MRVSLSSLARGLAARKRGFKRLLVLAAVNGLVLVAVTYRLANKQEALTSDEARLSFELEQAKEELERLERAETLSSRNASVVRSFWEEVVPERAPGLTEAWDEIDRLAGETNVVRGRTGYDRELLDVGLERIQASMPLTGAYFDLVRFLNRLERSERFFLVEEVRLSRQETEDARIRLDCRITFFLRPEGLGGPQAVGAGR